MGWFSAVSEERNLTSLDQNSAIVCQKEEGGKDEFTQLAAQGAEVTMKAFYPITCPQKQEKVHVYIWIIYMQVASIKQKGIIKPRLMIWCFLALKQSQRSNPTSTYCSNSSDN